MIVYFLLASFFLFLLVYHKVKYRYRFIFTLPIIVFCIEIGKTLGYHYGFLTGYNGFIFFILLITILLSMPIWRFFNNVPKKIIVLLGVIAIYFISRIDFGGANILNLITRLGNFLIILFLFIIGFNKTRNRFDLYFLNKNLIIATVIFIIITSISTILSVGKPVYQGGVIYGPMHFQLYYPTLFIILYPLIIFVNKLNDNNYNINKNIIRLVLFFSLLIISLSLMRSTWMIVLLGLVSYFIFSYKNISNIKSLVFILLILVSATSYIYVNEIYLIRENRFNSNYDIQYEGRIIELKLTKEIISQNRKLKLFGTGSLFNEKGKYGYRIDYRGMHGTYSRILFGSGYLGLFLFISYLLLIFWLFFYKLGEKINKKFDFFKNVKAVGIGVYIGLLFAFFSANTSYGFGISYFAIAFLYLGVLSKLIVKQSQISNISKSNAIDKFGMRRFNH